MSEYRSKQTSSGTTLAASRSAAPATPRKLSTLKRSSVFPGFSTHIGFDNKMDELFGHTNVSLSEGTAEGEFERYVSGMPSPRETDILQFWAVSFPYTIRMNATNPEIQVNRSEFPTLFAIAVDYLPIQASSVPCERVFSSAKETDTLKRNRIHSMLMEALQTLKFSLKKDRGTISFTGGWKTAKVEMMRAPKTKGDLLAQLLTEDDSQAITDTLLKLQLLDDEQVELDGGN